MSCTLTVNATDFKNKFGEYLKEIYTTKERVIVEKSELPVLAVMSYQDYQELIDTVESLSMYSKPEIQKQIEKGEADIKAGKGVSLKKLKKKGA